MNTTFSIGTTFGEVFIGVVVGSILYGITLLQTYNYYDRYKEDRMGLKLFVAFVWLLDTIQLVFVIHSSWVYLITDFANPLGLAVVVWSLSAQVIVTALLACTVQYFYATRVWKLSNHNFILVVPIFLLGIGHVTLATFFAIKGFQGHLFANLPNFAWPTAAIAISVVSDCIICASMCYYLWKKRNAISSTNTLLSTLMVYAVNTLALTTVCTSASAILYAASSKTFLSQTFFFALSKLYTNSVLATLNSRHNLKALRDTGSNSIHLSKIRSDGGGSSLWSKQNRSKNRTGTSEIEIVVTNETMDDGEPKSLPPIPTGYKTRTAGNLEELTDGTSVSSQKIDLFSSQVHRTLE